MKEIKRDRYLKQLIRSLSKLTTNEYELLTHTKQGAVHFSPQPYAQYR